MSYAIIRNRKYKRENLKGIFRHNERKNTNYSNKNIDKAKSCLNYSIKSPQYSYEKEFDRLKEKYNLKGEIKTVSNIACEYIITSDKDFFEKIGQNETKRYFETAYQFVSQYKNLGEQYILSANVHLDEETPHLHLVFVPVIHTKNKYGNEIDKIACSEFWKEKDSYKQLQNAFHKYMVEHNFQLDRGIAVEESERKHFDLKEFKDVTNFEKTKEKLKDIKLELPDVPNIEDIKINRLSKKRDEKILETIIKPKEEVIKDLYQDNIFLRQELLRKSKMFEKAEKYQKEREKIIEDNENLHNEIKQIKSKYKQKENDMELEYMSKIRHIEKENHKLHRIIDKFYETIEKFIIWICKRFDVPSEDYLVREFQDETYTLLDAEKQIEKENKERKFELEL